LLHSTAQEMKLLMYRCENLMSLSVYCERTLKSESTERSG